MFEFSIIKKSLWPGRKKLSTGLIAAISLFVISSIVWLSLVFFSVMDGIEFRWLEKCTTLHPPIRVTPTPDYYSSYYYNIDALSEKSDYSLKSLREKIASTASDPYSPERDMEIPISWPAPIYKENGALRDLACDAQDAISKICLSYPDAEIADYEMGAALLSLSNESREGRSILSQIAYLGAFPTSTRSLSRLLICPSIRDVSNLIAKNRIIPHGNRMDYLESIFSHIKDCRFQLLSEALPLSLLPENSPFLAVATSQGDTICSIFLPKQHKKLSLPDVQIGTIMRIESRIFFHTGKDSIDVSELPISFDRSMEFRGEFIPSSHPQFRISGRYQKHTLTGVIDLMQCKITSGRPNLRFSTPPQNPPPWAYYISSPDHDYMHVFPNTYCGESGIVLPSHFQSSGTAIGDTGYISYNVEGGFTLQENRAPIHVAGFYDPGPISTGMNYLFVPQNIIDAIKASPIEYALDTTMANGFGIWSSNLKHTKMMQSTLQKTLRDLELDRFWKVSHFSEYPFVKNLLRQFQSDRYLFSLISGLILIVACSNICSLLILLINNKRKEIAILTVMGASKLSIAMIFSACGLFIGLLSMGIGIGMAHLTIKNISVLIRGIRFLQGDLLLDPLLSESLPRSLSIRALWFVSIATPLCALLSSLIPVCKLRHIDPKETLQS